LLLLVIILLTLPNSKLSFGIRFIKLRLFGPNPVSFVPFISPVLFVSLILLSLILLIIVLLTLLKGCLELGIRVVKLRLFRPDSIGFILRILFILIVYLPYFIPFYVIKVSLSFSGIFISLSLPLKYNNITGSEVL